AGARRVAMGATLGSCRTGADVSPLQGRALSGACPQVRRRTGYLFIREKDYLFKRSTELVFKGNHAL
ncbi:hypothetical protein, partial [Enterobacter hormaechei]|uniref:hypothetical protein n=1 Tax=Enterobacter hormaechei TaxID=158836 RepID=UPI001969EA1B